MNHVTIRIMRNVTKGERRESECNYMRAVHDTNIIYCVGGVSVSALYNEIRFISRTTFI